MARRHRPHFLDAVTRLPHAFVLRVAGTSALLADRAALAAYSTSRRRGLLGRHALAPGEALVIAPTQGIHTFGMRFAIDVVFADRRGTVVAIATEVPPHERRRLARLETWLRINENANRREAERTSDGSTFPR